MYTLPKIGKPSIALGHFPTRHQAFIFRAYEYVSAEKIAEILGTTIEKVISSAREMGLSDPCPDDTWLSRGYITIIRRMWHILPYDQLLRLIGMDEEEFAVRLKEEDFLGKKLGNKPFCEPVVWRELTDEERAATAKIKAIMDRVDLFGVRPFDFKYEVPKIHHEGREVFSTRMIYAFSGLYQHAFDVDRLLDAARLCEEEEKIARLMLEQMNKNAAIGYEAANHYYFSKGQLAEKIVNCHYVREAFINKYSEK